MYLPIRKTELSALLKSDSATLRKFGERVVAEVAKREQEEIDKLHEALRKQETMRARPPPPADSDSQSRVDAKLCLLAQAVGKHRGDCPACARASRSIESGPVRS